MSNYVFLENLPSKVKSNDILNLLYKKLSIKNEENKVKLIKLSKDVALIT